MPVSAVYIVKFYRAFEWVEWNCRRHIDAQKDLGAHVQVIREVAFPCDRCPA